MVVPTAPIMMIVSPTAAIGITSFILPAKQEQCREQGLKDPQQATGRPRRLSVGGRHGEVSFR
jgi:hypothetical protein